MKKKCQHAYHTSNKVKLKKIWLLYAFMQWCYKSKRHLWLFLYSLDIFFNKKLHEYPHVLSPKRPLYPCCYTTAFKSNYQDVPCASFVQYICKISLSLKFISLLMYWTKGSTIYLFIWCSFLKVSERYAWSPSY